MTANSEPDIALEASVDVSMAAELRGTLDMALAGEGPLRVDAAGVERTDTAGVQLLLALCREAARRERPLVWQAVSPALRDTAARLGLHAALGLPEDPASTED